MPNGTLFRKPLILFKNRYGIHHISNPDALDSREEQRVGKPFFPPFLLQFACINAAIQAVNLSGACGRLCVGPPLAMPAPHFRPADARELFLSHRVRCQPSTPPGKAALSAGNENTPAFLSPATVPTGAPSALSAGLPLPPCSFKSDPGGRRMWIPKIPPAPSAGRFLAESPPLSDQSAEQIRNRVPLDR